MRQGGKLDDGGSKGTMNRERSMRPAFWAGAIVCALLSGMLALKISPQRKPPLTAPVVAAQPVAPLAPKIEPAVKAPLVAKRISAKPAIAAAASSLVSPELLTPEQLADELSKIGKGPITAAQAARFKADLKELIRRGAVSVPALEALLQQNFDESFGSVAGGDQLGYPGLRASVIDALNQIGGAAAQSALLDTMNTTAVPAELLQIAQDLDKLAPGQYNDEIVSNAQTTLALAAAGQLGTNAEIGPAYRALQNYSAPGTTADAANNDPLDFYNAVQLANLPNGQGLSTLLQMEQNSAGASQAIATDMIAQMAGQNGDALTALAQMAQNGQISQNEWVQIAPILAGAQYQMNSAGDDYTVVNSGMTQDQINQRIQMLNTLMGFVPEGTGGAKAMQQEINTLSAESGN